MKPTNSQNNPREDEVAFFRHSNAFYRSVLGVLGGGNPTKSIDADDIANQQWPDLTPEGIELAKAEAEKYFSTLDPDKDVLFFASSDQVRAIETGKIYLDAARKKGFQIIERKQIVSRLQPRRHGQELAQKMEAGDIKVLKNLWRNIGNVLAQSVFNPNAQINKGALRWDKVDPAFRARWESARAIVEADPQFSSSSWGENFVKYSKAVKKFLPEITTARELYDKDFANLVRLAEFGLKKVRDSKMQKNIKILAFGHENYLGIFLEDVMKEKDGIKNCEVIRITETEKGLKAKFRGKEALIKPKDKSIDVVQG